MSLDLRNLRKAVRHEGGVSRRLLLAYAGALSSLPNLALAQAAERRPVFAADPFSLGVASGDPDHAGVVLWTRLAPDPLSPDGGMAPESVPVQWEVAEDDAMTKVVRSGTATAARLLGHSVHVEVDGLRPDRWYWYRFRAGDAASPVARTRTLPEPGADPAALRFAFASCQHYEAGLYTAYEQMAKDDLDLVMFLGDYIYEGAPRDGEPTVRRHIGPKLITLADYRIRHAQYRGDPLLQAVHARFPWFVTWDDHEVSGNYAGDLDDGVDPVDFLLQRANAYQVYYEQMPLRRGSVPRGPDMQLYRRASFGKLAELFILDTRQYRTDQVNNDDFSELNAAALDPRNTLLGARQKDWLKSGLSASPGRWNVLAQQVMMAMGDFTAGDPHGYNMDSWTGYAHERMDLVRYMAERRVANPVVLTGDIHAHWVNELRVDDRRMETPIVATEFIGTSISSSGDGVDPPANLKERLADNPYVKFFNRKRGYVRCHVTPKEWRSDYMTVDFVSRPGGTTSRRASFVVEAGRPGVQQA